MKKWMNKHRISLIAILFGALAGYFYYAFVGCKSGNCFIVSRPYIIIPYGALLAFLLVGSFNKKAASGEEQA